MNAGIIAAAGRNPSMGIDVDRAFLSLGTRPVLAYSMMAYEKCPDIDVVVVVVRKGRVAAAQAVAHMFGCQKVQHVVAGSGLRQTSVLTGLDQLNGEISIVSIHDASRPCVTPNLITLTVKTAKRYGSGVAAIRTEDSVKEVQKGQVISKTLDRSKLWITQTPQSFKLEILRKGLDMARDKGVKLTDDASAAELVSNDVRLVPSTIPNVKISTADDLALAAAVLRL